MQLILLKAKLHQVKVTQVELEYQGSCAIDEEFMQEAGILENEQIHIYNLNNGERLVTYAIKAEKKSRMISVNGAAAHKAKVGDRIIICSYAMFSQQEALLHQPKVVLFDQNNQIKPMLISRERCGLAAEPIE